jgi:hypothetical protein
VIFGEPGDFLNNILREHAFISIDVIFGEPPNRNSSLDEEDLVISI